MRVVFKYEIPMRAEVAIEMPNNARVLHVEAQREVPCLWALVDTDNVLVERHFRVAGTGHPLAGALIYVGSFFLYQGSLVFHVFEME